MAADWMVQYTVNLDIRDQRESKHREYIDAYTALADRGTSSSLALPPPSQHAPSAPGAQSTTSPPAKGLPATEATDTTTLRAHLLASNQARTTLRAQLSALETQHASLSSAAEQTAKQLSAAQRQCAQLETRVRDRDHELREKAKLVESVQDEMVGLTLALNLAEEKLGRVEGEMGAARDENEELVRRWVERVGWEAGEAGMR